MLTPGMDAAYGSFPGLEASVLWPDHPRREKRIKFRVAIFLTAPRLDESYPHAPSQSTSRARHSYTRARGECVCCIRTISASMLNLHT